jgi:hypothetical protein
MHLLYAAVMVRQISVAHITHARWPNTQCHGRTNLLACRNDVVAMHGALSDYLIKVVPSWIKFAVAGPGQSTNVYNEQTIYTTPEHLMPLIRCVVV